MQAEQIRAWALLVRSPGITPERIGAALQAVPDAASLVAAPAAQLQSLGFPESTHRYLAHATSGAAAALVDADLSWLAAGRDRHLVSCVSAHYPRLLRETSGAPVALYVRGSLEVLERPMLAIVGSRNPTAAGRETSFDFARHLAGCGLVIASGLAEGVDAAAHRGALAAQAPTVAVCGTGLAHVYPGQHAALAEQIAAQGALVSEFPPDTGVRREHFPQRNRVLSGLALGTLVVEAARQSGSLITARFATEQGREVFAIPGSIHSPLSRGCHRLIREGAKLVETADDVLAELGMVLQVSRGEDARAAPRSALSDATAMDKEYEILLDALGFDPTGTDALVERSGLKPEAIASMLLILELRGEVEARPGGRYCRKPNQAPK